MVVLSSMQKIKVGAGMAWDILLGVWKLYKSCQTLEWILQDWVFFNKSVLKNEWIIRVDASAIDPNLQA